MNLVLMKRGERDMKFILFVEGHTEAKAIPPFLKRWLDPRLSRPVGIQSVRFNGWAELVKDSRIKANLYLSRENVIAVVGLLDLYGPIIYPQNQNSAAERYAWAKQVLEGKVNQSKFFQFFAVHETEAWLLCDSGIFPNSVRPLVEKISQAPEGVDNTTPPSKQLNHIYRRQTKRNYRKITHGKDLFERLDPDMASQQCPHLKDLLETMLCLAREAGH